MSATIDDAEWRIDPTDGNAYTKAEFIDFYGAGEGLVRWGEAKIARKVMEDMAQEVKNRQQKVAISGETKAKLTFKARSGIKNMLKSVVDSITILRDVAREYRRQRIDRRRRETLFFTEVAKAPSKKSPTRAPTPPPPSVWRPAGRLQGHSKAISCITIPAGCPHLAVSGSDDTDLRVWRVSDGRCLRAFSGHDAPVRCVASADAKGQVFSGDDDGVLIVWDVRTGAATLSLKGHNDAVSCLTSVGSYSLLISGSEDGTIRVWAASRGDCLRVLQAKGRSDGVWSVCVGQTARYSAVVVSGSSDGTIRVWDYCEGVCLKSLTGHADGVWCICNISERAREPVSSSGAVSPSLVATGSWDKTVRVWDIDLGQCLHVLRGHTFSVTSVTILHWSGRLAVVSASEDKTLRLWDPRVGKCLRVLKGAQDGLRCVCFNGSVMLTGCWDSSMLVWADQDRESDTASVSSGGGKHGTSGVKTRKRKSSALL